VQQVAVRAVDFRQIEAYARRAFGSGGKGGNDAFDA